MNRTRQSALSFLLIAVLALLSACSSSNSQPTAPPQTPGTPQPAPSAAPKDGGHLRIALAKNLVTLDPTFAMDNYSSQVIDQIFDTLVTYAPDGSIAPRLATSWKGSPDATSWEFTIRKGVKFHNGRELTADDVVWTMNRMLDPQTKVPRQHLFMVAKVEKSGADQVTFTLNEPFAPFLSVMASRALSILPKEEVEARGDEFARNPVGTGPFTFLSWHQNDGVVLERNPDYFFGKPHLEKVTFKPVPETTVAQQQLETGDIDLLADVLPDDIDRLMKAGYLQLVPGQSYYYGVFNLHPETAPIVKSLGKNPYTDKRVREAITLAFDVDEAIRAVYPGLADQIRAYGPLPNGSWAYDPKLQGLALKPNLERAKQLLADAGYPNGFETRLLVMSDSARQAMGQILQNSLAKIGIKATIESPDFGVLLQMANDQTFDIGVFGWGGSPDPHDFIFPMLHTSRRGPGGNNAYYSNPEVDRLIDEASATSDQAKRKANYDKVQEIFAQEYAHLPLFYKPAIMGMGKNVRGLTVDQFGYFPLVNEHVNVWLD